MAGPIVVVGSANMDLVCTAEKIPTPGETVWGDRFERFHGGKGANQAVAAARLGADVRMVAKVGDDEFGAALEEGLRAAGVETGCVRRTRDVASGVALISVDHRGQNSIVVVPGANGQMGDDDLEQCGSLLRGAGLILAQLEIPLETVTRLGRMAREAGVPLMLDPAPARPMPAELLECVTYLTPNESETATLCGLESEEMTEKGAADAAARLLERGPKHVLLKMGGRGVYVAGADGTRAMIPALRVPVVDTTAAGDAFNGALAAALMRGMALEEAAHFAVAVAGVSTTRGGAQVAMPTADEAMATLRKLGCDVGMVEQFLTLEHV